MLEPLPVKLSLFSQKKQVRIGPGDYYVTGQDIIISTLLGSCVAACLYDPVQRIMGMNHFLLAFDKYGSEGPIIRSEAGRYGVNAMELLINALLKRGAHRRNLRAKAFGGASVFDYLPGKESYSTVGDLNCQFVREFLKTEGIPLVSSRLGGELGRVIYFSFSDFSVYVREIKKMQNQRLAVRDKKFLEKTRRERQKTASDPDLWL